MARVSSQEQPVSLYRTQCVCAATRRAARCVTQLYDLVLAPVGLKATQFVALQAIDSHGEIAQFELAREYAVAVETLSRRFSTLRKAGWIQVRITQDHNARRYSLTPEGKRVLETATPYWVRAQNRLADVLGSEEKMIELIALLDALSRAASEAVSLRTVNTNRKVASSQ